MSTPRVWLITGTSTGFGRTMAELVLSKGDIVVATLRKPEVLQRLSEKYSNDRLLVLKVDVTNQADIDRAFAQTREVFGRLDVVFNNAGFLVFGEAESTPNDVARGLFDVNFWGAVNVSLAAVKFFREVNKPGSGGVLLQNSSICGLESMPGVTFYSASKHAFDGFSEGLVKELLPKWNIKVCIIQSGGFNTNVVPNSTILPENPVYEDKTSLLTTIRSMWNSSASDLLGDPSTFVKVIYALVEGGDTPLYFPVGQDALKMATEKVELLKKSISEAQWKAAIAS